MPSVSRRRFLQITTAGTGAVAAAAAALQLPEWLASPPADGEVETTPTYCDICFWKCGAIAYTRGGRLWKVEGHPEDPLSRGRLCPRGTGGVGAHYDPTRLRAPLLRRGERGSEEWAEVTWDEALDFLADRLQRLKADHGAESLAMFSHGVGGTFFRHALRAYGTPNFVAPSYAQCRGPVDVGFSLTFGEPVRSPERTDIHNARCLVLIGSHLGENMHNTQVQEFGEAIERGASIIVVDPRFSVAAGKARYYLPIKPGTDMALLLAWMHVLVQEDLYDRDYVAEYGGGFDAFVESIAAYTPEWAAERTTLPADMIRETAREMARCRPATLVHPGRHVTWYGDDAQRSRAIALLNALLGSWGRRGGFYRPGRMSVPGFPYPPYPAPEQPAADNPDRRYPFAGGGLSTGVRDATLTGQPYPIKGWFVYATNLLQAMPNQQETIRAIQNLDLLAVVDVVPSEIAGWADVVLPESVFLERHDDLNAPRFREPFVSLRQPVVEPPADQKPNWWIARELALKLDLGEYFPWQHIDEYLQRRVALGGHDYQELTEKGILLGPRPALYFEDGVPAEFPTPSGKIEFFSEQLEEAGFDPVPRFTPPPEPPAGFFRLLYGRSPVHTFARTQSNPLLGEMMSENEVWIHADSARELGLATDDRVRLENQDGIVSDPVKVKATQRIRRDSVYLVHGFGQQSRAFRGVHGRGAADAQLITRYAVDPLMGATGMRVNFVTILAES